MRNRADIARSASTALLKAKGSPLLSRPAVVGFDGFIDAIIHVVDQRRSLQNDAYTRLATIEAFSARCGAAAGKSANIELVVKEERFGGNGPLMAGALGQLSLPVTYIGAVGQAQHTTTLHPIFAEFAARCERVFCVAPPAHTDALEFEDGKLMLGKPANVQSVTWDALKKHIGLEQIKKLVADSALIGIVNWVMMAGVEGIWMGLCDEVLATLPQHPAGHPGTRRRVFIDLCDPAKRTDGDVARAMSLLTRMNTFTPVTLGLNLSESERIAKVMGVDAYGGGGAMSTMGSAVEHAARAIRERLQLECVVIHPREGAGAADASGASGWFDGPFTATPKLSTGAGDHFNGGFSFAQTLGLPLDECLAVGCGVSGAYVRDAASPTLDRLAQFLADLPGPEGR